MNAQDLIFWAGPLIIFMSIFAMMQSAQYPVTQILGGCRLDAGQATAKKDKSLRSFTTERFRNSRKYRQLLTLMPPKGERLKEIKADSGYQVKATFKSAEGVEYVFTAVKRTKADGSGWSAFVIDDISGGEFSGKRDDRD